MRLLKALSVAALSTIGLVPLEAQTADQARLIFTVGFGMTATTNNLWRVGNQPFLAGPATFDTLSVERDFRRSLNVVLSGTYFPGNNLGFNVEAQLLGLATKDKCRIRYTTGSFDTQDLCNTIDREERSATSAAISGGVIYRVASRSPIHPYVRSNAGLLITQQSFLKMRGFVGLEGAELNLYEDRNISRLQPYLSFGGGVVAVIAPGYQFRAEIRDNLVWIPKVDGPTDIQGLKPPNSTSARHVLSLTIGFDVVLERKRGRRY